MKAVTFGLVLLLGLATSQEWVRNFDGGQGGDDLAYDVAVSVDGDILVGGEMDAGGYSRCVVLRYSREGDLETTTTYDPYPGFDSRVLELSSTREGGAFAACMCKDSSNIRTVAVLRLRPDGTIEDTIRYSHASHLYDSPVDMQQDAAGNCLVVCRSKSSPANDDCALIKCDSSGMLAWVARYDFQGCPNDASAVAVDSLGNAYVAGKVVYLWSTVASLVKFDPNGDTCWTRRFVGDQEAAEFLEVTTGDGGVYAAGYLSFGQTRALTVKYSGDGDTLWSRERIHGLPLGLAGLDSFGVVLSCRANDSTTMEDFKTIHYSPDGVRAWSVRYDGSAHAYDSPRSVAIGPGNRVHITGTTRECNTQMDCRTLCYDDGGSLIWEDAYNGDGGNDDDEGTSLRVDSLGNTVVVGFTTAANSGKDILVIKYPPAGPGIAESPTGIVRRGGVSVVPSVVRSVCLLSCNAASAGHAFLISDMSGQVVRRLSANHPHGNSMQASWGLDDDFGQQVPKGVYLVMLDPPGQSACAKIVVQR